MPPLNVSLHDIFEISSRNLDGRVTVQYCRLLDQARDIATAAATRSESEISIDYYTNIMADPLGSQIKPAPEKRFGEIHFDLNDLLSTNEGVLEASRSRALSEVDEYMKEKLDADLENGPQ